MAPRDDGRQERRRRLILGLGNPGRRYRGTRHNVGFEVVLALAERLQMPLDQEECRSLVGAGGEVLLAVPQTFMNRSGHAARCLAERHGLEPEDLLVVIDDVNLPLGRLRLRAEGSPGGHRGLESVLESLQSARVARLRLGVRQGEEAPRGEELVDYVLTPFGPEAREAVAAMVERAADACEAWLGGGAEAAMNRFNG